MESVHPLASGQLLKCIPRGFGYLAFAGLSSIAAAADARGLAPLKAPHFPGCARHVIFLLY